MNLVTLLKPLWALSPISLFSLTDTPTGEADVSTHPTPLPYIGVDVSQSPILV